MRHLTVEQNLKMIETEKSNLTSMNNRKRRIDGNESDNDQRCENEQPPKVAKTEFLELEIEEISESSDEACAGSNSQEKYDNFRTFCRTCSTVLKITKDVCGQRKTKNLKWSQCFLCSPDAFYCKYCISSISHLQLHFIPRIQGSTLGYVRQTRDNLIFRPNPKPKFIIPPHEILSKILRS